MFPSPLYEWLLECERQENEAMQRQLKEILRLPETWDCPECELTDWT